jgi:fructose-1,6-bisphosphatase/inositol monophosphatase family enzyme
VTLADRAGRSDARDPGRRAPEDTVIGEEFGTQGTSGRSWVLDPIDGGRFWPGALFGTLIALVVDGFRCWA